jgi:proteasome assembly chaperone (PAC2) family protein
MEPGKLQIYENPNLSNSRMLMGFSGWMDGGDVSTGSVKCFIDKLGARKIAEIEPEGFYIESFPASMETAALFRPHTKIESGLIKEFEFAQNEFFYGSEANLVLFLGKEPNLFWRVFAERIFEACTKFDVKTVYFIGSVAGLVPHTREPRIICSVSDEKLRETLRHYGMKFSKYEGPASIITYLTTQAAQKGVNMMSLVAMIPAYVQGHNAKCIEAVVRRLSGILEVRMEMGDLQAAAEEFEKKLHDVVQEQPELVNTIRKLEEDYDNEIFDTELGDLKKWLEQQGIRLD